MWTPRPAVRPASAIGRLMMVARCASPSAPARSLTPKRGAMTRLKEHYDTVVRPSLTKEFSYENALQVPRLSKIVVNIGVGEATQDVKKVDAAVRDLTAITGQKPVVTRAK